MTAGNLIPRTCTEVATGDTLRVSPEGSQPLSAFRDVPAYVLLGEPGAGKTTEFDRECEALGDQAEQVAARRFANADIAGRPEWRDKVLFIDGLDETRAGGRAGTKTLDQSVAKLEQLGSPRFRISCRSADWLGPVDRSPLADVSPDKRIVTLQLDPLHRLDVHAYLEKLPEVDATDFISKAEARGLGSMMNSPLSLQMLVDTTGSEGWPSTRREALEGYCLKLAQELREDHPRAAQTLPSEKVLTAAGRLCAIQLISGKDGFALGSTTAKTDFIPIGDITEIPTPTGLDTRDVLATSLFVPVAENCHAPKHRQIAEYLAARYIAGLLETRTIPLGRVLTALTSLIDDRVVTDLRGLSAWLGALSKTARFELARRDPVAMGLYGDIPEWLVGDRRLLLKNLVSQVTPRELRGLRRFDSTERRYRDATAWSFRSLCKPDMADTMTAYLDSQRAATLPDHILELLLRSLAEIEDGWRDRLHTLVPHVRRLALDTTTAPDARLAALLAYARIEPSPTEVEATLRDALEAVRDGRFADPDDKTAGSLLRLLYPHAIGPDRIWEYASLMRRGSTGEGWYFWRYVLCDETPTGKLANLLDNFADDAERLWPIVSSAVAEEVLEKLLVRALREFDHLADPERLYRWIAAVAPAGFRTDPGKKARVREWLRNNGVITKRLLRVGIARPADTGTRTRDLVLTRELLLAAGPPDFVEWCAQQARVHAASDWNVACAFANAPLRYRFPPGETDEELIERLKSALANDPQLLDHLNEYLTPSPAQLEYQEEERLYQHELADIKARHEKERQQRQHGWRDFLQKSRDDLAKNRFSAQNLHTLALAYFGRFEGLVDLEQSQDRVAELIGDNSELLNASIAALRDAPLRDDLRSLERAVAESRRDWLTYPVLAGLAIRESAGTLDDTLLSDDIKRKAFAMYAAAVPLPTPEPAWPERWLRSHTSLLLEVLHKCSIAAVKRGDTHLSILDWLGEVDGLEDELRDFRIGLLRAISVRLPTAQLPLVDDLLVRVSEHPDTAPLKELVAQKLRSKSMTDAQRVRWMTVDALMNRGEALGSLDDFIGSNAKRARHLAKFLSDESSYPPSVLADRLLGDDPCATLHTLIGILGRHFPPHEIKSGEVISVGPAVICSDLVGNWIIELGGQPTEEAGAALEALIADKRLSDWNDRLGLARNRQRRLFRDASYAPMSVADVIGLLRNGPPANVADLAVLLDERLRDIGSHIRGDNSDPWRQFWADDQNAPPQKPKHEDSCRDALLSMLRNRLPAGVAAHPEPHFAADRRADICVASNDFSIPVEIKKNTHAELWTAIQDQLIAKYTTDPKTGGHGVYVVLWFGSEANGYPRHPTGGDRPRTPEELAHRLSESLSHEQRRTIRVVVLDVTKP